ncbi:zinc finger SWIM domain-containing protein 7 isoform X2 [Mirounga angustirostris]|uniref:zinc finger SWIM domain-containing protein 7 isoform X2 n=1 Tax=Mirounga angustirostris TaxID=9716 RepID=UPI00313E910E
MHQSGEAKPCCGSNDPRMSKTYRVLCLIHASHPSRVDYHSTPGHLHSGIPAGVAAFLWNIVDLTAERKEDVVLGSSGKTYTCLASCHYCSCPAFAFSVLRKSDSLLVRTREALPTPVRLANSWPLPRGCKHLLAVYLSQVMRTCRQLKVSDKQLTDILLVKKKQEAQKDKRL